MDVLDWLGHWFEAQCDGEWEHGFGPSICTLDNPGWSLKIDLAGTDCDGRTLGRVTHDEGNGSDWWTCWTEDNAFHGAASPLRLRLLLETFRDFATVSGQCSS